MASVVEHKDGSRSVTSVVEHKDGSRSVTSVVSNLIPPPPALSTACRFFTSFMIPAARSVAFHSVPLLLAAGCASRMLGKAIFLSARAYEKIVLFLTFLSGSVLPRVLAALFDALSGKKGGV